MPSVSRPSRVSPRHLFGVAVGAAIVVSLAARWLGTEAPDAEETPAAAQGSTASQGDAAQPHRSLPTRQTAEAAVDPRFEGLYATLTPDEQSLRCRAANIEDGLYTAVPAKAELIQITGGQLFAAAATHNAEVRLQQDSITVGFLRWDEGGCTVEAVSLTSISGTLSQADATPAVDHVVRGCRHGEVTRTDADGRWTLAAARGTTCWPMAFVEAPDGRFGRTAPVSVEVQADGPSEAVALVLPPDDALFTVEQQRQQASQLALLFERRLSTEQDRLTDLEASARNLSDDQAALAEPLLAHRAAFVTHVEGEIERLRDPEEQVDALVEAWLALN